MPLIGFVLTLLKHLLLSRFDFHLQNVLDFHHLGTHKFELPLVKLLECKINNMYAQCDYNAPCDLPKILLAMYAQCDYNAPCDLPKILLAIVNTTPAMFLVSLETL